MCDFQHSPARTYMRVEPENNYSQFHHKRLTDNRGHECTAFDENSSSWLFQDDYDKAGRNGFIITYNLLVLNLCKI